MQPGRIAAFIREHHPRVDMVEAPDALFFYFRTDLVPIDRRFAFATIVSSDDVADRASRLDRPGLYRLNLGISPTTYQRRFGDLPAARADGGVIDTGHDYTALDRLMPHPIYAFMAWVCVISPSDETFIALEPLIADAYRLDADRTLRRSQASA